MQLSLNEGREILLRILNYWFDYFFLPVIRSLEDGIGNKLNDELQLNEFSKRFSSFRWFRRGLSSQAEYKSAPQVVCHVSMLEKVQAVWIFDSSLSKALTCRWDRVQLDFLHLVGRWWKDPSPPDGRDSPSQTAQRGQAGDKSDGSDCYIRMRCKYSAAITG